MTEAPFLTQTEVQQAVERIFRKAHRSRLVALYGRGEASDFELDGHRWRVVPTRCELDLREQMPRPGETCTDGSVFLVDWTAHGLPLDVACRLADARLFHVARDARLAALFGARQVEPGLAGSAVAKLFLTGALEPPRKVQGFLLTARGIWTSLLEMRFQLPESVLASPGALLGWAAANDGGPAFVRKVEGDVLWREVRRALEAWLRAQLGDVAAVVWRAWECGLAARLLEVVPLLEAARVADNAYEKGRLEGRLEAWLPSVWAAVLEVQGVLVEEAMITAALPADREPLVATLTRSQALAESAGIGALTSVSDRLPGGHRARERALGGAVMALLEQPSPALAAAVKEALTHLEAHTLDRHLRSDDDRDARRSVARLGLWLAHQKPEPPWGTRWQPTVDLASRYAQEGGYVEWARQHLRGLRGGDEALLEAARRLENEAARIQREEHRAFAEAYVAWLEAGKPSSEVTPIEKVGEHVIEPFLRENTNRKLLVVLMDGMSHATAAQLLTGLANARQWAPIAWRPDGWTRALPHRPVLAVAPTLTEISRAAFFAGKDDRSFGDQGTDKDPSRWDAHRALAGLRDEDAPRLFVRRDFLSGLDPAPAVLSAVAGDARLVAVVVNAIDEDLSGSVQVAKDYSRTDVRPLDALLNAAEDAQRVVLLVADHGHVLGDRTQTLPGRVADGRKGGARWRALAEGETPEAEEVLLPASCWTPAGWDRVAALWDPDVIHRSASYGAHGGISLSEVVVPAFLIAPAWLEGAVGDDSGLASRPLVAPDWWNLRARREATARSPGPQPASAPPVQASLFAPAVREPVRSVVEPARSTFVDSLRRSSVFRNQTVGRPVADVDQALEWLALVVEAGGSMSAGDFAAAAGIQSRNIGGAVARMGVLNADGFAMVEFDAVGRRVVAHRSRLSQHYGIDE